MASVNSPAQTVPHLHDFPLAARQTGRTNDLCPVMPDPLPTSAPAPAAAPLRVLHADDDSQVTGIVALFFEAHGNSIVTSVDSGSACLALLAHATFDVILLDLRMPDMDGLQVLTTLTARGDQTPVIMVSSEGQSPLAVRALRAGAFGYVNKGGDPALIVAAV
eukprot:gene3268-4065_t